LTDKNLFRVRENLGEVQEVARGVFSASKAEFVCEEN
jgi:hypothetical protein